MSILKELNELAAKYSEDYEKEATIEGAIDAIDKSLESALGTLSGAIEDFEDLTYGADGEPDDPAEGSILGRIDALEANSGTLVVGVTKTVEDDEDVLTLDRTWQEIYDAPFAVVVFEDDVFDSAEGKGWKPVVFAGQDPGAYIISVGDMGFTASSADDYPVHGGGGK